MSKLSIYYGEYVSCYIVHGNIDSFALNLFL